MCLQSSATQRLVCDAVMVCNGHYSEPRVPEIDGQGSFPGRQVHSHNYRTRDAFAGQRVLVVGAQSSGIDISREIAAVAKQVRALRHPGAVPGEDSAVHKLS